VASKSEEKGLREEIVLGIRGTQKGCPKVFKKRKLALGVLGGISLKGF